MILIFEPAPPFIVWSKRESKHFSQNKCLFKPGWFATVLKDIGDIKKVKAIGYVLHHGGEEIDKAISRIVPETIKKVKRSIKYFPEYNSITSKVLDHWMTELPDISHVLLCETAYFLNMPQEASTYAVPYELRKKGIRRYGGYGLCHQWASEQMASDAEKFVQKLVSVYLGDTTNIAAIKNGKAIETSIGFTPVENMLSLRNCGDIDPTIIFKLHSTGMSFEEINELLSEKSGFVALNGGNCSFLDIVQRGNKSIKAGVREIFLYTVIKHIGSFISILGGVDALVFTSEHIQETMDFIQEISDAFAFLGLVDVVCLKYNKHEVMTEKVEEEGGIKW